MKVKIVSKPTPNVDEIKEHIKKLANKYGLTLTEDEPDVVIAVGGDGTLLKAIRYFKPIVAVKAGRRGFMMDVLPENLEQAFSRLVKHDYVTEEYMLLETEVEGVKALAFNEIGVLYDKPEALKINVRFLEDSIVFEGDGVLVSTPQGSSAWSFSISGNYVYRVNALEVCLVNPILTSLKSVVIPPVSVRLSIMDKGYQQWARVVSDGEIVAKVRNSTEIEIRVSDKKAKILRFYKIDPIQGILNGKRDI
ncbi:MAG: NAD(+)/NADH kinase [Candidatus Aramenus sp.]|nr:NAD(+)/NADH kinase [Candidatus Aramenus sp.]